jgi:ribonuclease VapC
MMVIDASALVALLLSEPEAAVIAAALEERGGAVTTPTSMFETVAALVRVRACSVSDARVILADLMSEAAITIQPVTAEIGEAAITAFDRYGKGRHPASLNMGDCYSYALAKTLRLPILFKGDDFGRSDLEAAV